MAWLGGGRMLFLPCMSGLARGGDRCEHERERAAGTKSNGGKSRAEGSARRMGRSWGTLRRRRPITESAAWRPSWRTGAVQGNAQSMTVMALPCRTRRTGAVRGNARSLMHERTKPQSGGPARGTGQFTVQSVFCLSRAKLRAARGDRQITLHARWGNCITG